LQRAKPDAEKADPLATGLAAHLQFMSERSQAMDGMSPGLHVLEVRTLDRMRRILQTDPNAEKELPLLLHARAQREALAILKKRPPTPEELDASEPLPDEQEFNARLDRFEQVANQLRGYRSRSTRLTQSPWEQRVWLIRENQAVQDVLNLMADRLMTWALEHINTAHKHSPAVILSEIAGEPEMQALFRAAQALPLDAESFSTARDVPVWQRTARIVWGFIPVLGDLTDLSEALAGWDIVEQRPLSGAERVVMLLGALLPLVPGSALRGAREGIEEAAERLAARAPKASAEDMQRVLRAADAIAPEAKQIEHAVKKLRAGERLTAKEAAVIEGAARRVEYTAAPGLGETLIKEEHRSGLNVDVAAQGHRQKTKFRKGSGRDVQSAHLVNSSSVSDISDYVRDHALTILLPTKQHKAFDDYWKKWARNRIEKAKPGEDVRVTVAQWEKVLNEAAQSVPELRGRTADTMSVMIRTELYQTLGLKPDQLIRLPFSGQ
jgi:hypothetical protein